MNPCLLFLSFLIFLISCSHSPKFKEENQIIETTVEVLPNNNEIIQKSVGSLKAVSESGELVALLDNSSFSYLMYRGIQVGYEYELLKMFCEDNKLELKIKIVKDAAHMIDSLAVGHGHLAASNFAVTTERKKEVNFSNAFFRTKQVLVQRLPSNWRKMTRDQINTSLIKDPLDLEGKTVTVKRNSSFSENIKHFSYENGLNIMVHDADKMETTEDLIELVENETIEYTIVDQNTIDFYRSIYPNLDFNTPVSFNQNIAWAVNKNNEALLELINTWVQSNKGGKRFNMLKNKYFKVKLADRRRLKEAWRHVGRGQISEYDKLIKEYSDNTELNWLLMSALIYQESKFDKKATSWVGARGLSQMMPKTAMEFKIYNPNLLYVPETSIDVGTRYYRKMYDSWLPVVKDSVEAHYFSLASYNSGKGHVFDARRLAQKHNKNPNIWFDHVEKMMMMKSNPSYYNDSVVKFGYCVGKEPVNYVRNIIEYYNTFKHYLVQKG